MSCDSPLGIEVEAMRDVLLTATDTTPADLPIVFSHAPLTAFPRQFDVIISHEVIYLLEDLDTTFEAVHAALKPGGIFCAATAGYIENEYYRRWRPQFEKLGIQALSYSKDTYVQSLKRAGFHKVDVHSLLLTEATYTRWRSERPFHDLEWFESEDDVRHYFTHVGKLAFLGKKVEIT